MTEKKEDFKDRLVRIIGETSVSSFGRKCGIGESSLRQYLQGAAPRLDRVASIAKASNVNIEWLATGEGPMHKGEAAPAVAQEQQPLITTENAVQSAPYAAFDALEVVDGMGMLTKIYRSGDTTYIRAINANLMAFSRSIDLEKSNEDMQTRIKTLENTVATLEEKLNKLLEVRQKVVNGS